LTFLPTCQLQWLLDELHPVQRLQLTSSIHHLKVQQPAGEAHGRAGRQQRHKPTYGCCSLCACAPSLAGAGSGPNSMLCCAGSVSSYGCHASKTQKDPYHATDTRCSASAERQEVHTAQARHRAPLCHWQVHAPAPHAPASLAICSLLWLGLLPGILLRLCCLLCLHLCALACTCGTQATAPVSTCRSAHNTSLSLSYSTGSGCNLRLLQAILC
jgi:hypothetical protein